MQKYMDIVVLGAQPQYGRYKTKFHTQQLKGEYLKQYYTIFLKI